MAPRRSRAAAVRVPETSVSEFPRLRLTGSFAPRERIAEVNEYPVVLGFTNNGHRITLAQAVETNATFSAPGFTTQELSGNVVLVGAHFASLRAITTTTTWAGFTYLAEWIGYRAFHDDRSAGGPVAVTYRRLEFPTVPVEGGAIRIRSGWRLRGDSVRERAIEARYSIEIDMRGSLDDVIVKRVQPLQNLLTLAVDAPNVVTRVTFRSDNAQTDREGETIEAIYPVGVPEAPRRVPSVHDMLFAYPDLENDFGRLVNGWYRVHSDLQHVCDLYFSTRRARGFVEVQFLTLVRAVEVYDRLIHGNAVRPKSQHKAMLRALVAAVPTEHQTWLRGKLAFSNEPALCVRISRLLAMVPEVMQPIVGDLNGFAKRISDTRNYYTHYDESLRRKASAGEQLFRATQQLGVLIAALLLLAADLDRDSLHNLFARKSVIHLPPAGPRWSGAVGPQASAPATSHPAGSGDIPAHGPRPPTSLTTGTPAVDRVGGCSQSPAMTPTNRSWQWARSRPPPTP